MHVGIRLRRLREEAGLSVSELARRIGVKHPSVSAIEHGRALPSFETLNSWLDACGAELQFSRDRNVALIANIETLGAADSELVALTTAALAVVSVERKRDLRTLIQAWLNEATIHAIRPTETK